MENLLNTTPSIETINQKVWFINAPYSGHLLFNGEPTSLLYAVSPTVDLIKKNKIKNISLNEVALLNPKLPFEYFKDEFNNLITKQDLKIVAISTTTASCVEARKIAKSIKSVNDEIIIIFGGPHEDDLNENEKSALISDFKVIIDFSVAGDGEYLLQKIIRTIFEYDLYSPRNLKQYIQNNKSDFEDTEGFGKLYFVHNNSKWTISFNKPINYNLLPIIPRELLNENDTKSFDIFSKRGHSVKTAQILTERGCPWNCTFCSESTKAGKDSIIVPLSDNIKSIQSRPIESVIKEIRIALKFHEYCKKHLNVSRKNYEAIFFDDSTFTHKFGPRREYLKQLLSELKILRNEYEFEWGCQTRIDQFDEGILSEMIEAGCTYIYIGLESVNDNVLKQMAKGMTKKQIENSFKMLESVNNRYKNILRIGLSLVFGIPSIKTNSISEDKDSIDETLNFVAELNTQRLITLVSINTAVYYPSTLMTKHSNTDFDFHYRQDIPNNNYPWNRFEEGLGYHHEQFSEELADYIIKRANYLFGDILVNQDIYNIPFISNYYWKANNQVKVSYLNHASIMKPENEVIFSANQISKIKDPSMIEKTRKKMATLFDCNNPSQIIFGRNTSEACSLAIWLSRQLNPNISQTLLSDIENYSILRVVNEYSDHANVAGRYRWASYPTIGREFYQFISEQRYNRKLNVNYLRTNGHLNNLENLIIKAANEYKPDLVIVSHVERTTGRITQINYLTEQLKKINPSMFIIIDGAKAFGALKKVNLEESGADFYLAGPHFTIGSYPVGVLFTSKKTFIEIQSRNLKSPESNLVPILQGMFSDEFKLENVSENLNFSDIGSLYEAVLLLEERKLIASNDFSILDNIRRELKQYLIDRLIQEIEEVEILSPLNRNYVNFICSFRINNMDLHSLTQEMWLKFKICISYISKYDIIRASFNYTNTTSEIDYFIKSLKQSVSNHRRK